MSDVFELQDRITESVVAAVAPKLQFAEFTRQKQKPAASLDAYDFYLRALQLDYECTEASLNEAIRCLDRAVSLDPTFAPAVALASFCYGERALQAWAKDFAAEAAEAVRLANRAVGLDPQNAEVLWMSAFAFTLFGGDPARGRELFDGALAINPNAAMGLAWSSLPELSLGNMGLVKERVAQARRFCPRDPREWMLTMLIGMAHVWGGREAHSDVSGPHPDCGKHACTHTSKSGAGQSRNMSRRRAYGCERTACERPVLSLKGSHP
jgi:tetratricopeptide (TPR) repeat protein